MAAFRPLMTNSSISTFYSSRASGLLRRPLTPSSTASSSEHGATVAHDSDEDVGSSQWKPLSKASGAHSPLHLFENSLRDHASMSMDASCSIVDDNDELSSFFNRTPEALQVDAIDLKSPRKNTVLESPEFASELNWLNSRNNGNEFDKEYPVDKQDSRQGMVISAFKPIILGSKWPIHKSDGTICYIPRISKEHAYLGQNSKALFEELLRI